MKSEEASAFILFLSKKCTNKKKNDLKLKTLKRLPRSHQAAMKGTLLLIFSPNRQFLGALRAHFVLPVSMFLFANSKMHLWIYV